MPADAWEDGAAYDAYVGRWSRLVAHEFVRWLALPQGSAWLDFGCGSGALTESILAHGSPRRVVGCDQSSGYIDQARRRVSDARAEFVVASLSDLPVHEDGFDACVSGLVLNFLPNPADGIQTLANAVRRGGTLAAYVWDYADGMALMRLFWDAVVALDPAARALDEGVRFPLCRPDALRGACEHAGVHDVDLRAIDVPTMFADFDDYWQPFLGGQGPAPGYVQSLSDTKRESLREHVRQRLPFDASGRIPLTARAWAISGRVYF